ncbi:MAG: tyrosine-type recombinase/integrase, partial [Ruminococcus sp.]|nr:tyrosine-type recombinase/integrase [Ruminococcus sp.]
STTIARRATSVKMFFKYLRNTAEVLEKDPTVKLKLKTVKKEPLKYMDETECITLLNSIDGLNKERDYCILLIFINCGVRLSELVRLNDTDIKPDGTVSIKGENGRTIYFNKVCMEALEEYNDFKEEYFKGKRYDHHAVFVGQGGKRLTGRWIEEIVKRRMKKAGLGDKGLSPCNLRHTSAMLMYRHGIEISMMKDILGHKAITSTEIYAENKSSQIESVMKNNSISRNKK